MTIFHELTNNRMLLYTSILIYTKKQLRGLSGDYSKMSEQIAVNFHFCISTSLGNNKDYSESEILKFKAKAKHFKSWLRVVALFSCY